MKHEVIEKGNTVIIALKGEVDLESSPMARELLLGNVEGRDRILVDLSAVTYIDSSGIATLVEAFQRAKKKGGQVLDCDKESGKAG